MSEQQCSMSAVGNGVVSMNERFTGFDAIVIGSGIGGLACAHHSQCPLIPDIPRIAKCLVDDLATMARPVLHTHILSRLPRC
jgi:hypothetical protein